MTRALYGCVVTLLLCMSWPETARAESDKRVVVVNAPPLFAEAVQRALAPWPVQVRLREVKVPLSESMPGARKSASAISQSEASDAVVWISSNSDGQAVWMYDAADDRVVVRELLVPQPLDEAGAAAAALSVKSLLLHSSTAPAEERFGAQVQVGEEHRVELVAATPARWGFVSLAGVEQGLADDRFARPSLGLGVVYRIRSLELGARVQLLGGHALRDPAFAGNLNRWALGLEARYAISLGDNQLGISAGPLLAQDRLQGTLLGSGQKVDQLRVNPSLGLGAELCRDVGPMRLGLGLRSTYMLRSQRYLVGGQPVLDLSEVDIILNASALFWLQ